jgi:Glycoside hydrolase family 44
LAHGDLPLIEWYLKQLAEHEKKTGVKVLDILDLHFYPQGKGIGVGTDGNTDPDTNALRIRSTRGLWDPHYVEESWIKESVHLIPRMRAWSDTFYPGLKLSIGEYSFGAERHMSGGLALAEALGRFGQQGLYSAFYWVYPPENSPAFYAFRAFRDFDGKGSTFQALSMPTEGPRDSSIFASRSADGTKLTLVLLNLSPTDAFDAGINLKGCAAPESQRFFTYTGNPKGFVERQSTLGRAYRLPAYSISVVELKLKKPGKGK